MDEDNRTFRMFLNAATDGVSENFYGYIQRGFDTGQIILPDYQERATRLSGGTNLCPNSDFSYSEKAALGVGVLPTDAAADNRECHRVFRQEVGADIDAQRLRTVEANGYIPQWDLSKGDCEMGRGTEGDPNYDIAFKFTNNWLEASRKWHIRMALATTDSDPLPSGSIIRAGFWVKTPTGEGWAEGDLFTLSYRAPVKGTQQLEYYVVAKGGGGLSLGSAVLSVNDAPDVLSDNNFVEISYTGAVGLVEFEVYRKHVSSGLVYKIAHDRNSDQLYAYDTGQVGTFVSDGFPVVANDRYLAIAETIIDAQDVASAKIFNNLTIQIPFSFDNTDIVEEGVYLRIQLADALAKDRQLRVDTVWASETFSTWSPSPFDNYLSAPTARVTSAPPILGGGVDIPPDPGGGSSCLWVEHDVLLSTGWVRLQEVEKRKSSVSHGEVKSPIKDVLESNQSYAWRLEFDSGLVLYTSRTQRFGRAHNDMSGVDVFSLKEGDFILGGDVTNGDKQIKLVSKTLVTKSFKVRALSFYSSAPSKLYPVGDARTGEYAQAHNLKSSNIP